MFRACFFLPVLLLLTACPREADPVVTPTAEAPKKSCARLADIAHALSEGYGESAIGSGMTKEFYYVLFASRNTWTVVEVDHNNVGCLIAAGKALIQDEEQGDPL